MRITHLSISNFRGVSTLNLSLAGQPALLLGANGAGKSATLTAAAKALGVDRGMRMEDVVDPTQPVELTVTLDDLGTDLTGVFSSRVTFGPGGPTLTLGVHAVVDGSEIEMVHGFPDASWARASRAQLRTLPVLWLGADRQHEQLLQLAGTRSLLAKLVNDLDLDQALGAAGQAVAQASSDLADAPPLQQLLDDGSDHLTRIIADAPTDAFGLRGGLPIELLRQLELTLAYSGRRGSLGEQASGLGHLAVFALALVAIDRQPGTLVLLDEPEISLAPHALRSVIEQFREGASQLLMATHSGHALVGWDLRRAIRLEGSSSGTAAHVAGHIADVDERRLARYATAALAEALFSRTVILVEGPGDRLALRVAAKALGLDLDAAAISVIELDGADLFGTMRTLLGPGGLGLRIIGLCDADREGRWADVVLGVGTYARDRATLTQHGVFVLDPDLEGVLVDALGESRVEAVIDADSAASALATFRQQPSQANYTSRQQLVRYVKKGKARWPPLLMADCAADELPSPVVDLLQHVR